MKMMNKVHAFIVPEQGHEPPGLGWSEVSIIFLLYTCLAQGKLSW